jgi:hypothetical protein
MKYLVFTPQKTLVYCLAFCAAFVFFSCSSLPTEQGRDLPPATIPELPPEIFVPDVPLSILGDGQVPTDTLARFLGEINTQIDKEQLELLAAFYAEEAAMEGVNHDIAFAQMCLETGFLRYGGLVTADMNNFCGLGATGPEHPGERFSEPRIGVRAHIQHLKAYATDKPLNQELVDPRYRWVRYGSAPTIQGLSGTWASDREYADKIENILERLYRFTYAQG